MLPWSSEALLLLHVGVFSLHRKEEPGRKSWEGREAGLPWRVTAGGTQQSFPPISCDLAGVGQDPGGEKFSAPLASAEVSLSRVGLHFYVSVPLISLLDSMCSFSHSFFQTISIVVNILELQTTSPSNKTRIFNMAKRAATHLFRVPCPHSLCSGHSCLAVPQ